MYIKMHPIKDSNNFHLDQEFSREFKGTEHSLGSSCGLHHFVEEKDGIVL